ncbi:MAG: hypothetical protein AAGA11_05335 [Pseudomonadota bacterium]
MNKNVRFRTTYYFRVIDFCGSDTDGESVAIDSLYRFRMSGKAHPGLSQVKFESGTLTAQQVDPFGAEIGFDPETQKHHFLSASESKAKSLRTSLRNHLRTLNTIDSDPTDSAVTESRDAIKALIKQDIAAYSADISVPVATIEAGRSGSPVQIAQQFREGERLRLRRRVAEVNELVDLLATVHQEANEFQTFKTEVHTDSSKKAWHDLQVDLERTRLSSAYKGLSTRISGLQSHTGIDEWGFAKQLPSLVRDIGSSFNKSEWKDQQEERMREELRQQVTELLIESGEKGRQMWLPGLLKALPENKWVKEADDVVNDLLMKSTIDPSLLLVESPAELNCGNATRGFQILGPEGWRTFDQDERLLLAMTTSAKPLIQSMQAFSSRVEASRGVDARDVDLALATSRQEIAQFRAELESAASGKYNTDTEQINAIRMLLDSRKEKSEALKDENGSATTGDSP